ncbi:MAG TPA: DUF6807 family protein, partial [Pirellula sp.]|nr:DUF6807 family protein [Pirellula sp.]
VTRWHFSPNAIRPFFYPLVGPSGAGLTRMGHPGAPNHDHHRSLWFAHADLLGYDFWSEGKPARIMQKHWYAIEDSDDSARIGLCLHWLDGHDPLPLLQQDVIATIRPHGNSFEKGWSLELQSDFSTKATGTEFRKSNFGILGLRLAKSISVHFGGGTITGADGKQGEANLFGNTNRWIDYSGPSHLNSNRTEQIEGITLIDHCDNLGSPAKWHVRSDGWIGPSLSREENIILQPNQALTVRYLLDIHPGPCLSQRATVLADRFDKSKALGISRSNQPHLEYEFLTRN